MSEPIDATPPCPEEFPDSRVAALVSDSSDLTADAHVGACRRCAEAFFDHAVIAALVRRLHGIAMETPHDAAWARPLRRLGALPLAAAVLVAIGGVAVATVVLVRRPVVIESDVLTLGRAGEIEDATGLPFAAAGVAPGDRVVRWVQFTQSPTAAGRAALVETRVAAELDLVAFGSDRSLLWHARGAWSAADLRVLDRGPTALAHFLCVVTDKTPQTTEESLVAILSRDEIGAVALIDPQSGTLRGTYFHPGRIADDPFDSHVVASAPLAGAHRRLIVFGEHDDRTNETAHRGPCVSVLEVDGTLVQHVVIPGLGISGMYTPRVIRCQVDWSSGHETVELLTSEWLWVAMPWRDGRLVVDAATVTLSDALQSAFDRASGPGAFRRWSEGLGGIEAAGADVATRVREAPLTRMTSWRDW